MERKLPKKEDKNRKLINTTGATDDHTYFVSRSHIGLGVHRFQSKGLAKASSLGVRLTSRLRSMHIYFGWDRYTAVVSTEKWIYCRYLCVDGRTLSEDRRFSCRQIKDTPFHGSSNLNNNKTEKENVITSSLRLSYSWRGPEARFMNLSSYVYAYKKATRLEYYSRVEFSEYMYGAFHAESNRRWPSPSSILLEF